MINENKLRFEKYENEYRSSNGGVIIIRKILWGSKSIKTIQQINIEWTLHQFIAA